MEDDSKKLLQVPRISVFQAVNKNTSPIHGDQSPVVVPKFKISRGTQASAAVTKPFSSRSPLSPPVPAKPATLSKPSRSPAPPVPPKPLSAKKAVTPARPVFKPALPPKPLIRTPQTEPAPPIRVHRALKAFGNVQQTVGLTQLNVPVLQQSRKSLSLGRLEGIQHCFSSAREVYERNLKRDSGFVSWSLENVDQHSFKLTGDRINAIPVAPPRRRRKSADSCEPIYAVIDFSKKRNRRLLLASEQSAKMEETKVDSVAPELLQSPTIVERESSELPPVSDQMDSDIHSIETSFATIASIIESFTQPVADPQTPKQSNKEQKLPEIEKESKEVDEIPNGHTILARLVFGGSVVQAANFIPSSAGFENKRKVAKEFSTALKDAAHQQNSTELSSERQSVVESSNNTRQSSPAPSISSTSSNDSLEGELFSKNLDPDAISCGSLGDVDTSDATRQSSLDEDSAILSKTESTIDADNSAAEAKERSHSFGLRRTLDTLLSSLSKAGIRKSADKRKTLVHDSSSTDTEPYDSRTAHHHLAPSQKFNRADRVYRSAQSDKVRANSLDGQSDLVDRRHSSLSPVAGSPETPAVKLYQTLMEKCDSSPLVDGISSKQESEVSRTCGTSPPKGEDEIGMHDRLEGKERKAYMTAREIASSERVFVDCLRLICVDFRAAVKEASITPAGRDSSPVIPDGELNKILNYLPQLQNLNQELLNDFELRLRQWTVQPKISDVIVRKGPFLKLYSAYIRDFQSQTALLDECIMKYPRFGKVLREFEQSERCKSLSLKHYMLKPVQRLPQYRLLLEVYLRHIDENSVDYHDTLVALKVVTDVAEHANNSMKQEDNFQKLLRLQSRLGNCEIIRPGRYIIKEGELDKVSRKTLQPRYFILLNDCLLYTSYLSSPSPDCSLKLHHELPLSRMEVQLPTLAASAQENANEFNVISTARSFTLAACSSEIRDEWMNGLSKAINDYHSKQSSFPRSQAENSEYRLGQQAPVWIPDCRVTMCQLCTAGFSITFRRHHCRACGKVVCRNCSSHRASLEYLKFRSARVCDDCYAVMSQRDGSAPEESMDNSNCSSIVEMDLTSSLVNVPPVCFVHAFNDDDQRPSSDPVGQSATQAALRAQQARRDHIRKERRHIPQRLMEVSANDAGSQISGYLSRRARRTWKRNWFVLKDRVLYIYKAPEDVVALDTIPVLGYQIHILHEAGDASDEQVFQLFHPKQSPIVFQADNAILTKKWIDALSSATVL